MTATALDVSVGSSLVLDGDEWRVERGEPHTGRVQLVALDGTRQSVTYRFLAHHPDCHPSSVTAAEGASRGRQPKSLGDLTAHQLELVKVRLEHLAEVRTGFRSGDRLRPGQGEPKPQYNPDTTTVTSRRHAKVAELQAMGRQEAKVLALDQVGFRTLIRWEKRFQRDGIIGCADDRWLRESGGHRKVNKEVREAVHAVRQETKHLSKVSMTTKARLITQYMHETFGTAPEDVPSYWVLRKVWYEWFGSGRGRQRNQQADDLVSNDGYVLIDRPGKVVALDTTVLPVMVRESVFDDAVKVHLTLALCAYTHSICAFRLTLVSDTSVDVAMLLRDVMLPLPMRDDWGEEMEWPYPGLPASVVAEFAGHEVAGLPFLTPETVTTDHGSIYRNHHLVQVQEDLGCNILPSRVLRPEDKALIERVFGSIRSLLFEWLPGYTGVDVADRGVDPEGDAVLTIAELEHVIATWIVGIWQKRRLGAFAPHWDPGGDHSPNSLMAASFEQGGFALEIPSPQLYYKLLPEHTVKKIDAQRGVKIRGLWYDGPALTPHKGERSSRGGQRQTEWVVHREPRDRRTVFFQDPFTHEWHPLRWTGLPADDVVPAFGDKRVTELLRKIKTAGLKPRTDQELLPQLLALMHRTRPVKQWTSRLTKSERIEVAREREQARAAAADRPQVPVVVPAVQRPQDEDGPRPRRELAGDVPTTVAPPPRLGNDARRRPLFVVPPADATEADS
ncbi:DDE-type integrase/transposase/recombinase [Streptomyces sp. GZWMJZ-114]|uniref:DDE-type integrase/transposase/recombinase n=1 Tax=Streptomyces sp. GZWMJZ-114 TaxID=2494734 RepID=UPI0010106139|nr:DDE-type integrase/transposase/recombinase [Streptomyces sp. GZWMJZ-114]